MERRKPITFDIEKYRPYIEHYDMSEEEKTAFLEALWSIMEAFVDDAWGLSSSQLCEAEIQQKSRNKPLKMIQYLHAANDDKPAISPRAKDQTKKKHNG